MKKKTKMDYSPLNSFLTCWIFVMISSMIQVVLTEERITSEYFTAFINISYYDHTRGVLHTGKRNITPVKFRNSDKKNCSTKNKFKIFLAHY